MNRRDNPYSYNNLHSSHDFRRKKYNYILWIIVVLVLILISLYIINQNFKTKIDTFLSGIQNKISGNSLLDISNGNDKCKASFNECKSILEAKWGISIILLKKEQFNNEQEANNFFDIWAASFLQNNKISYYATNYPVTLFAIRLNQNKEYAADTHYVVVCDTNGNIIPINNNWLC
ncbi:MAG: hypothetical protein Q8N63_05605 [Nanoarchaeota archaeon]|nr:hypothetical protein [Nanoarchaeota archaeon]